MVVRQQQFSISLEPRVNFLLVAMAVLIWFLMNQHNFFTQPP
jgi:hypothetical protein